MNCRFITAIVTGFFFTMISTGQTENKEPGQAVNSLTGGFIRSGFYYDLNRKNSTTVFSSAFSDFCFKTEVHGDENFRAASDVRFRYGSEFGTGINTFTIREAFAEYTISRFTVSVGQQVVNWGRADFNSAISKLNPRNYILRSPDYEDMDMGNILTSLSWQALYIIRLQAVFVPFYRPSMLLTDPVPLPYGVAIEKMKPLITGENLQGYGLKASINLRGVDLGLTWFDGYDPMPGIKLNEFSMDMSGQVPQFSTKLKMTPYKIRSAGIDFESVARSFGIRGEAAFSMPYLDYKINEYVPLKEIRWAGGFDYSSSSLRLVFEYSGKYLPQFTPSSVAPLIGTEPDMAELARLLAQPGFDIAGYIRDQTAAFNRLYNYQLKKSYHSVGLKAEQEMFYGRVIPSAFVMYNFTSRDLFFIPSVKIKPADGFTITAGADIYSGKNGSLYHIINDFMESVYLSLRADF